MPEGPSLLLVEWYDDFANLMRRSLEQAGHPLTVCTTGAEALGLLVRKSFDLVLMCDRFPDMTGYQLLQILKSNRIRTPAIMLSGWGDSADEARRAGFVDFVVRDRNLTFLDELPKRANDAVMRSCNPTVISQDPCESDRGKPDIVLCPSCNRTLFAADETCALTIRCPVCGHTWNRFPHRREGNPLPKEPAEDSLPGLVINPMTGKMEEWTYQDIIDREG